METTVNGMHIYYEKSGEGRPFILLHGNGEDHTIFDKLVPQLAKEYCVYALDTRGHGRSGPVAGAYHYTDMAEDVAAFLHHQNLADVLLYGFSDGGIVGLLLAARYPGLLSALMVSGVNTNPAGLKGWFRRLMQVWYFFTRDEKIRLMLAEPAISPQQLQGIKIPTLLLAGEKDVIRPAHMAKIAREIPHAVLRVLPGEDHASYVVHSEKLYPLLRDFLAGERA